MTRLVLQQSKCGSLSAFKLIRLFRGDNGIWRYEIERTGKVYWSSLHTRDEARARGVYERIERTLAEWDAERTGVHQGNRGR